MDPWDPWVDQVVQMVVQVVHRVDLQGPVDHLEVVQEVDPVVLHLVVPIPQGTQVETVVLAVVQVVQVVVQVECQ